jgi:hypothetical protein
LKKKTSKNKENTNVEFGMEFGDINAAKQFEVPFMNQKKETEKK